MKKIITLVVFAFLIVNCTNEPLSTDIQTEAKQSNSSTSATAKGTYSECDPISINIMAGQFTNAGKILVENDATNLYVTYSALTNWYFSELHLFVGPYANVPIKNGNPIPGQFPYNKSFNPLIQSYTFTIPLSSIVLDDNRCLFIAAHSSMKNIVNGNVVRTETGWAGDIKFPGKNWATYFKYCLRNCETPPPVTNCDTAYMFGNNTFIGLEISDKWGWATYYDNVADGTYNYNLYAGAGQNNINNGYLAGTVTIVIQGSSVKVTINATHPGTVFTETHVYLSDDRPTTAAPGLYGNQHTLNNYTTDSYDLTYSGDGNFWIIVHAAVCTTN
ncbi:hypothetical protein JI750_13070 [Flavobacterium sp. GN10]|uniref:Uncharacterized protein n=1 Tax=Flavobacterium tagetis TaxID=2801336 RepID=A0ABS1KED7_9FLAO|nr:hypothetical protein [Flavobacterium tagetis]MBL0737829.1 hypothetical protein [Flavobacterium tagetis]